MAYTQINEGEWTDWKRNERWMCCDCMLVHKVTFRRRKGQLQLQMYRDERSTSAYRRVNGLKVMVKRKPKKK